MKIIFDKMVEYTTSIFFLPISIYILTNMYSGTFKKNWRLERYIDCSKNQAQDEELWIELYTDTILGAIVLAVCIYIGTVVLIIPLLFLISCVVEYLTRKKALTI